MSTTEYLDEDLGPKIIATICSLVCLSTVFVAMRLYVRVRMIRATAIDDYLVVTSLFFSWLTVALEIWAVRSGNGRHAAALAPAQQQAAVLSNISGFAPNCLAYTTPKFAVAALLARLLVPGRAQRVVLWTLPSVCLALVVVCVVVLFAQCTPARAQWDFGIVDKQCWSPWVLVDIAIVTGIWSAITDLYLAIYPATVLLKLQMRVQKKIALAVALGIGSISSIIAIYKTTRLPSLASPDFSYATADLVMWTVIEGNTLIVAACIPALGPLADLVLHSRAFGSSSSSRSGGTRRKHYHLPNSSHHYYHHHHHHHHHQRSRGGGDDTTPDTGGAQQQQQQHSYAAAAVGGSSTPLKDLLHNTNHHNNNNKNITNIITTDKGTTYPPPRFGKSGPNSGGRKRDGEEGEGKEGTGASSLAGSEDGILGPDDKPQQDSSGSGTGIIRGSTGILCSRSVSVSYAAARHAV